MLAACLDIAALNLDLHGKVSFVVWLGALSGAAGKRN